MEQLTAIEQKKQPLDQTDLAFLYEVDEPIQGFGYLPDPRILELRKGRDQQADMLVIFECTEDQIAHTPAEIQPDTKAYIGSLVHTDAQGKIIPIFQLIGHLENIYTQFPEKKIRQTKVEIGGKTKEQLQGELDAKNIQSWDWTKQLIEKMTIATERETVETIRLTIADLGFSNGCTTTQLFARAKELGLEFCPAEVGPHYRLQYLDQPENENLSIGMEPITDSHLNPYVFLLRHGGDKLGLGASGAIPDSHWDAGRRIAFRLRKVETIAA